MVIFSAESMSKKLLRFFLLEHSSLMILSVILISLGYSLSKKAQTMKAKHLRLFVFYGIGLLIILFSIPWPWRGLGGMWI
jgi:membrane protein DedA with SNARE-associated domain